MTDPIEAAIRVVAAKWDSAFPSRGGPERTRLVTEELRSLVSTVRDAVLEEAAKAIMLCMHSTADRSEQKGISDAYSAVCALKSKDPTKR